MHGAGYLTSCVSAEASKTIFVRLLSLFVFMIKDLSSDSRGREGEYEMRQSKQEWAVAKDRLKPLSSYCI